MSSLAPPRCRAWLLTGLAAGAVTACADAPHTVPQFDVRQAEPRVAARLDALRNLVRAHPDSGSAWGRLALNLQAHGFPEAAVSAYATARDLEPGSFSYVYLPAMLLAERRDERAAELFAAARQMRPDYWPLLLREAEWLLETDRPSEAVERLSGTSAEREEPALSGLLLGRAAFALGDTVEARSRLETVVATMPRYGEAHAQLAELYRRSGDDTAAELARERARINSDRPVLDDPVYALVPAEGVSSRWHLLRGQSSLAAGEASSAVEEFREAVRILPEDAHATNQLAMALEASGQIQEAHDVYRRALELRPDFPQATTGLARVLFLRGDHDAASRLLEDLLTADSSVVEAYLQLGELEQARGRPGSAIERYVEGLRLGSFHPRIAMRLAWLLATSADAGLRHGRQAVALAEHLSTLEMFSEPASLDVLAAAYAEHGDFERAIVAATRAATLARGEGDTAFARAIESRLALYESGRPFRM